MWLQLNYPNAGKRVVVRTDPPMTVPEVPVDPAAARSMGEIVRVRQRESLQHSEVSFDEVEPGRLGRGPDWVDSQPPK